MKTKENFMNDWFLNQHFSKDELEKLWNWKQKSNLVIPIKKDGKWIAYHTEDTEMEIDLVEMPTKKDCENWIKRLGFEVEEVIVSRSKKIKKIGKKLNK